MLGLGSPPKIFVPARTGRDEGAARFSMAEFRDADCAWLAAEASRTEKRRSPGTGWLARRLQRVATIAARVAGIFL
jgi:hypothetical protein